MNLLWLACPWTLVAIRGVPLDTRPPVLQPNDGHADHGAHKAQQDEPNGEFRPAHAAGHFHHEAHILRSIADVDVAHGAAVHLAEGKKKLVTQGLVGLVDPAPWVDYLAFAVVAVAVILLVVETRYVISERMRTDDPVAKAEDPVAKAASASTEGEVTSAATAVEDEGHPRRWYILACAIISVFGADIYSGMPYLFFPAEVGRRDGMNILSTAYLSVFPVGGMLGAWLSPKLLEHYPPNRLNRLTIVLCIIAATTQGICHFASTGGGFAGSALALRLIEGVPSTVTETCAMTMIQRSFSSKQLPSAMGCWVGVRQLSGLAGGPIGGALYGAAGFALPFTFGGVLLILIYAINYFTLANEESLTKTPENYAIYKFFQLWRILALALSYGADWIMIQVVQGVMQIWVGAAPYNKTPAEISVLTIVTTVAFMVGMMLFGAISLRLGIFWTGVGFEGVLVVASLFMGFKPLGDSNFPATWGAAIGICVVYAISFGMLPQKQPFATHVCLEWYGLPRESTDASIGTVFIFLALVGAFIGSLPFGAIVDAYGVPVAIVTAAGIHALCSLFMFVALWPYKTLVELGATPKNETDTEAEEPDTKAEETADAQP